jgi:predicted nucleic-acid-binding Zn-ribbon protein
MRERICVQCGNAAYQLCQQTHAVVSCEHCGYSWELWEQGYDEQVDDDGDGDEDDEDEEYVPEEWWEDDGE